MGLETTPKPSKYRNRKVTEDGVTWDSKKELARWQVLYPLFRAGRITKLRRQVRYPLTTVSRLTGERVKVATYVADFAYVEAGLEVVEDVKGFRTREYLKKRAHLLAEYGIEIRET